MNDAKTIELNGVRVTLRRRTYADKLESLATAEMFVPEHSVSATAVERAARMGKNNFTFVSSFIEAVDGAEFTPARSSMVQEEFEAAYQQFVQLDDVLIERLVTACNTLSNPPSAPQSMPPHGMTPEQRADPS